MADTARRRRGLWSDVVIVVALVVVTGVAHPVTQMLRVPFWVDESWVADLTRVPMRRALALSSSTPRGWLVLVRLVPGDGLQRGRLLALAFAIATVVAAYVLARRLEWRNGREARVAATAIALVVCTAPLSLRRNDLKQYTADAFFALAILAVGREVTRRDPRAVVALSVVCLLAVPFSTVSAFVALVTFGGVLVDALLARDRRRVAGTLVAGAAVGLLLLVYFAAFVFPSNTDALKEFWNNEYLTGSVAEGWRKLSLLAKPLAMPAGIFLVLFLAGVVRLVLRREIVLAVAVPLLWVVIIVLGALRQYPFLVERTSQWLLIPTVFVVAFGVVDCLFALARRHTIGAVVAALVVGGLFAWGVRPAWRELALPPEDIRTSTGYVADAVQPDDVILVGELGNFGFSYYWPDGRVAVVPSDSLANGFRARVANVPNVVYAEGRRREAIRLAVQAARARQRELGGRIFIVRTHLSGLDEQRWQDVFAAERVTATPVASGPEPALVVDPLPR